MFTVPTLIRLCYLYLFVLFFSLNTAYAQGTQCDCRVILEEVMNKVRDNYPGYTIKITAEQKHHFQQFTDSLKKVTDTASASACYPLLQAWIAYFNDKHLAILFSESPENKELIKSTFANSRRYPLTKDSLLKRWESHPPNSPEGIWNASGNNQIALIKQGDDYLGIVTNVDNVFWQPGQIKFELKESGKQLWNGTLYNRFHVRDTFSTHLDENSLSIDIKGVKWVKTYPLPSSHSRPIPVDSFYFAKTDSNNTLLRLPSFDLRYKSLIDSLITSNMATIISTPHLIVDLRGNLGGFNLCFEKLLPLIYTDTVITTGLVTKVTKENIQLYKDLLTNNQLPEKDKSDIAAFIRILQKQRGDYYHEPDEISTFPTVYPQPQKVALLIDEGCASATEFLILKAKQSKKVTLFGKRSAGIVDYSNLVGPRALSCSRYILWCPTARSARLPQYPIDNIGIKPDVEIPDQINWVDFVQQYLANQVHKIVKATK